MTIISKEAREQMAKHAIGKTITNLFYEEQGDYYVIELNFSSELCFRPMADLV
jgi:hypothetical protein